MDSFQQLLLSLPPEIFNSVEFSDKILDLKPKPTLLAADSINCLTRSVSIGAGAIALIRIFSGAYSRAIIFVKPQRPNFETRYMDFSIGHKL